ncbi:MAG: hypothetical protein ACPLZG_13320 [Thermoproteota archaeon]
MRPKKHKESEKAAWNRLIDAYFHPKFKGPNAANKIILDFFAHSLVEKNPEESKRKFIKYSLPKLIRANEKESEERKIRELTRLLLLYKILQSAKKR